MLSMEWCFRKGNADERQRWRRGEKRGLRKSYLWFSVRPTRLTACESLCCRISFISYWCYLCPLWVTRRLQRQHGSFWEGTSVGLVCVCVSVSESMCISVKKSCFRQYLYNRPPLHPLLSLSASTTVQQARDLEANLQNIVSRDFPLCWDQSVFFNLFSSAAASECYQGLYSKFFWTIC